LGRLVFNAKRYFLDQTPHTLQPVFQAAMDRFGLGEISQHGPGHWLKVYRNATLVAEQTPGADLAVCELFALLHDCERRSEGTDPQHGPRAAAFAGELHVEGTLTISRQQLALLQKAVSLHAFGQVSDDPTIGVCWDADRLDLPRVGIGIDSRYLSTSAMKAMIIQSQPG
jgi:uncharacterized protein